MTEKNTKLKQKHLSSTTDMLSLNKLYKRSIKFLQKALLTFFFVLVSILVQRKFTTDRYVVYKWSG